jgi:dienelactone hydrolase
MRVLALCLAGAVLAGCTIPPPPGDAPLRYRDQVFPGVDVQSNVSYGVAPDLQGNPVTLRLDRYEPAGDTAARRPAVIWVHGGGFSRGSRLNPKIVDLSTTFAKLGYVSVAISYRLLAPPNCADNPSLDACETAAVAAQHDAQAAVRWLRANATSLRIDPARIAIGGFSAGAITSIAVGARPDDPGGSGNPGQPSDVRAVVSNCGALPPDHEHYISRGDAPTLFIHGTADTIVPITWARSNRDAMAADGIAAILDEIRGAGHCPNWDQWRQRTVDQSKHWLYYMLGLQGA